MFVLLLFEALAKRWVLAVMPIARTGAPPGLFVNLALLTLIIVGLALSLRRQVALSSTAGLAG